MKGRKAAIFALLFPLGAFLTPAAALTAAPTSPAAGFPEKTLPPIDEATRVPSFYEFRTELKEIVAKKDLRALEAKLDDKIQFSFGADGVGPERFKTFFKLRANPEKSEIWQELGRILKEGAKFGSNENFTAPYYSSLWPENFDAYDFMLILGEKIPLRLRPSQSAPTEREASYLIVRSGGSSKDGWRPIELPNGKKAFAEEKYLRSAVGYRAEFQLKKNKWLITYFIAGD